MDIAKRSGGRRHGSLAGGRRSRAETRARKIPFALQIGEGDFAINQARATRDDLEAKSFPLDDREIEGEGQVPIPGDPAAPLDHCLTHRRP
jgi:hypothetical protein